MAQANEKPDKTHDMLIKKLNKLKTDLTSEGDIDTDLTKRQLRSKTLVAATTRAPSPSQTTTVDTTGPNSNIPLTEQDPSSSRFNSSENEGSHKGHRARIMKSNNTNKKPSPPFQSIKTCKHQLKTQKINITGQKVEISIPTLPRIRMTKTW